MTISAKVICDSINQYGNRLTTFQLRYPRFIHAEELTHRILSSQPELLCMMFPDGVMYDPNLSRNASSSRAIPVSKLIEDIERDPVYPSFWGKNQTGMQAIEECDALIDTDFEGLGWEPITREEAWDEARNKAIEFAQAFADAGYHKQIVNRLLEPFSHINVVVTATDYENFYSLRRHKDAQPEIKLLADAMWEAQQTSWPIFLKETHWHLPYVTDAELNVLGGFTAGEPFGDDWTQFIKLSVARCARVSYLTHEGKEPDIDADLKLYDRLVGSIPLHASPAEHQARPDRIICNNPLTWKNPELHGNLNGWVQFRKTLPNEFING